MFKLTIYVPHTKVNIVEHEFSTLRDARAEVMAYADLYDYELKARPWHTSKFSGRNWQHGDLGGEFCNRDSLKWTIEQL